MGSPRKPTIAAEARAKAKARAERAHELYVQKTYGLAPGEYARMLDTQDGRCAMCGRLARKRRLAVDHDHNTGRVRALLCQRCNQYLGHWEGDPIASHNAAIYLAGIAADYDRRYDPLPPALVEPDRPPQRQLRLPPLRLTR